MRDIHTPSAPHWFWSEHRRPTFFVEIQALSGSTVTLDATASDSGNNIALLLWTPLLLTLVTMHIALIFAILPMLLCRGSTLVTC